MSTSSKKKYTSNDLANAVLDVSNKTLSYSKASQKYGVPTSTIRDKIISRYADKDKPGPSPVLTSSQEDRLVAYIKEMAKLGYGRTKQEIPQIVKEILDKAEVKSEVFKDNLPSIGWVYRFLNRHPELSSRIPEHLGSMRSKVTETAIRDWFCKLEYHLQEFGINAEEFLSEQNSNRIYNCDETGFPLAGTSGKLKIITQKGDKNVYAVGSESKEQITVLGCASASGSLLKPYVIYKGERPRFNFFDLDPSEFMVGHSPNGWITSECFFEWLSNYFFKELEGKVEFPVILFVDGHSSHINLAVAEFCRENNIILFCFPPHASHIIQPLDVSVYGPMKKYWNQALRRYGLENPSKTMSKGVFFPVFKEAWDQANKPQNIRQGFKKTGLVPYNVEAVDYSKITNSNECTELNVVDRLSFKERLGIAKSLKVFENVLPASKMETLKRRFHEGYNASTEDSDFEYIWKIYKEIRCLKDPPVTVSRGQCDENEEQNAIISPEEDIPASQEESLGENVETINIGENEHISLRTSPLEISNEIINLPQISNEFPESIAEVEISQEVMTEVPINLQEHDYHLIGKDSSIVNNSNISSNNDSLNQPSTSGIQTSETTDQNSPVKQVAFENWDESPFKNFLKIPEGVIQRKAQARKPKIPFLISGRDSVTLLQEKQKAKEKEEAEKLKRKLEREKKRELQSKKMKTIKSKTSGKTKEESFCFECKGGYGDADDWIGCSICTKWFHKYCIDIDTTNMSDSEINELVWLCVTCKN